MQNPFIGALLCLGAATLIVSPFIYMDMKQRKEHQEYLDSKNCKVYSKQPTGKRVYCGKACFRDEIVTMYTCDDGPRVEVR